MTNITDTTLVTTHARGSTDYNTAKGEAENPAPVAAAKKTKVEPEPTKTET